MLTARFIELQRHRRWRRYVRYENMRRLVPSRSNDVAAQSGLNCVSAVPAEFAAVKEISVASANEAPRMVRAALAGEEGLKGGRHDPRR